MVRGMRRRLRLGRCRGCCRFRLLCPDRQRTGKFRHLIVRSCLRGDVDGVLSGGFALFPPEGVLQRIAVQQAGDRRGQLRILFTLGLFQVVRPYSHRLLADGERAADVHDVVSLVCGAVRSDRGIGRHKFIHTRIVSLPVDGDGDQFVPALQAGDADLLGDLRRGGIDGVALSLGLPVIHILLGNRGDGQHGLIDRIRIGKRLSVLRHRRSEGPARPVVCLCRAGVGAFGGSLAADPPAFQVRRGAAAVLRPVPAATVQALRVIRDPFMAQGRCVLRSALFADGSFLAGGITAAGVGTALDLPALVPPAIAHMGIPLGGPVAPVVVFFVRGGVFRIAHHADSPFHARGFAAGVGLRFSLPEGFASHPPAEAVMAALPVIGPFVAPVVAQGSCVLKSAVFADGSFHAGFRSAGMPDRLPGIASVPPAVAAVGLPCCRLPVAPDMAPGACVLKSAVFADGSFHAGGFAASVASRFLVAASFPTAGAHMAAGSLGFPGTEVV